MCVYHWQELRDLGCSIVSEDFRAKHLFGVLLPPQVSDRVPEFVSKLKEKRIIVSIQGPAVRISLGVYISEEDILALVRVLRDLVTANKS